MAERKRPLRLQRWSEVSERHTVMRLVCLPSGGPWRDHGGQQEPNDQLLKPKLDRKKVGQAQRNWVHTCTGRERLNALQGDRMALSLSDLTLRSALTKDDWVIYAPFTIHRAQGRADLVH